MGLGAVDADYRAPKARGVSIQLGGLGSAVSFPSGSGQSPAAERHLVRFWCENALSGKTLNAARGSGDRCKLPERVRAELGRQTTFWCIFGLKMLHLARPSLKFYHESGRLKRTGTAFQSSKEGPERRSGPIRTLLPGFHDFLLQ